MKQFRKMFIVEYPTKEKISINTKDFFHLIYVLKLESQKLDWKDKKIYFEYYDEDQILGLIYYFPMSKNDEKKLCGHILSIYKDLIKTDDINKLLHYIIDSDFKFYKTLHKVEL